VLGQPVRSYDGAKPPRGRLVEIVTIPTEKVHLNGSDTLLHPDIRAAGVVVVLLQENPRGDSARGAESKQC